MSEELEFLVGDDLLVGSDGLLCCLLVIASVEVVCEEESVWFV